MMLAESLWLLSFSRLREVPFIPSLHENRHPRGVFFPLPLWWTEVVHTMLSHPCILEVTLLGQAFHH